MGIATGSGTLTVSDHMGHTANITLLGQFMAAQFNIAADGHGGTLVTENVDGHAHTLVTLEGILPTSLKMGADILFHA